MENRKRRKMTKWSSTRHTRSNTLTKNNNNKWWCKTKIKRVMTKNKRARAQRTTTSFWLSLTTSMKTRGRCCSSTCNKSTRKTLTNSPSLRSSFKSTWCSNKDRNRKASQSETLRAMRWLSNKPASSKNTMRASHTGKTKQTRMIKMAKMREKAKDKTKS